MTEIIAMREIDLGEGPSTLRLEVGTTGFSGKENDLATTILKFEVMESTFDKALSARTKPEFDSMVLSVIGDGSFLRLISGLREAAEFLETKARRPLVPPESKLRSPLMRRSGA